MKNIKLYIIGLLVMSSTVFGNITKTQVEDIISKIDNAMQTMDANKSSNMLSDNVEIIMNATIDGELKTMSIDKARYIASLRYGWSRAKNYKYNISNINIKLQDNKAYVYYTIKESMLMGEHNLSSTGEENLVIEDINGELLITKIVANIVI